MLNKFRIFTIGMRQLYHNCKSCDFDETRRKIFFTSIIPLQIYSSLAFIWPVKKKKDELEDIKSFKSNVVEKSDYLFDNGSYEECYNLLKSSEIKDVEILWRLSRVLYNMSKESKYDKEKKKEMILQAFEMMNDLVNNYKEHSAVNKWYAILLNSKSSYEGITERIKQLENIKKHMDLAVTLDPSDATTWHMLGEWCYQVASLTWYQRKIAATLFTAPPYSTYEESLEYFMKAETVRPRFYSLNLLRLGECYLKLNKADQAKYYLQLALSYPCKTNDDHQAQKEAAKLLGTCK